VFCGTRYGQTREAHKNREKAIRRETREWRSENQSRSKLMSEAQRAFNEYIRERDYDLPCISCGCMDVGDNLKGGEWDCGHFKSVGSSPHLRFEELNSHKQCKKCNSFLSGNSVNYRINLCERIGENMVLWLEGPHPEKHYSREDLREIAKDYRQRTRVLRREREAR